MGDVRNCDNAKKILRDFSTIELSNTSDPGPNGVIAVDPNAMSSSGRTITWRQKQRIDEYFSKNRSQFETYEQNGAWFACYRKHVATAQQAQGVQQSAPTPSADLTNLLKNYLEIFAQAQSNKSDRTLQERVREHIRNLYAQLNNNEATIKILFEHAILTEMQNLRTITPSTKGAGDKIKEKFEGIRQCLGGFSQLQKINKIDAEQMKKLSTLFLNIKEQTFNAENEINTLTAPKTQGAGATTKPAGDTNITISLNAFKSGSTPAEITEITALKNKILAITQPKSLEDIDPESIKTIEDCLIMLTRLYFFEMERSDYDSTALRIKASVIISKLTPLVSGTPNEKFEKIFKVLKIILRANLGIFEMGTKENDATKKRRLFSLTAAVEKAKRIINNHLIISITPRQQDGQPPPIPREIRDLFTNFHQFSSQYDFFRSKLTTIHNGGEQCGLVPEGHFQNSCPTGELTTPFTRQELGLNLDQYAYENLTYVSLDQRGNIAFDVAKGSSSQLYFGDPTKQDVATASPPPIINGLTGTLLLNAVVEWKRKGKRGDLVPPTGQDRYSGINRLLRRTYHSNQLKSPLELNGYKGIAYLYDSKGQVHIFAYKRRIERPISQSVVPCADPRGYNTAAQPMAVATILESNILAINEKLCLSPSSTVNQTSSSETIQSQLRKDLNYMFDTDAARAKEAIGIVYQQRYLLARRYVELYERHNGVTLNAAAKEQKRNEALKLFESMYDRIYARSDISSAFWNTTLTLLNLSTSILLVSYMMGLFSKISSLQQTLSQGKGRTQYYKEKYEEYTKKLREAKTDAEKRQIRSDFFQGREREVRAAIANLNNDKKSVVFSGVSGAGKDVVSSIILTLMAGNDPMIPESVRQRGVTIVYVDPAKLGAGAMYRGQVKQQFLNMVQQKSISSVASFFGALFRAASPRGMIEMGYHSAFDTITADARNQGRIVALEMPEMDISLSMGATSGGEEGKGANRSEEISRLLLTYLETDGTMVVGSTSRYAELIRNQPDLKRRMLRIVIIEMDPGDTGHAVRRNRTFVSRIKKSYNVELPSNSAQVAGRTIDLMVFASRLSEKYLRDYGNRTDAEPRFGALESLISDAANKAKNSNAANISADHIVAALNDRIKTSGLSTPPIDMREAVKVMDPNWSQEFKVKTTAAKLMKAFAEHANSSSNSSSVQSQSRQMITMFLQSSQYLSENSGLNSTMASYLLLDKWIGENSVQQEHRAQRMVSDQFERNVELLRTLQNNQNNEAMVFLIDNRIISAEDIKTIRDLLPVSTVSEEYKAKIQILVSKIERAATDANPAIRSLVNGYNESWKNMTQAASQYSSNVATPAFVREKIGGVLFELYSDGLITTKDLGTNGVAELSRVLQENGRQSNFVARRLEIGGYSEDTFKTKIIADNIVRDWNSLSDLDKIRYGTQNGLFAAPSDEFIQQRTGVITAEISVRGWQQVENRLVRLEQIDRLSSEIKKSDQTISDLEAGKRARAIVDLWSVASEADKQGASDSRIPTEEFVNIRKSTLASTLENEFRGKMLEKLSSGEISRKASGYLGENSNQRENLLKIAISEWREMVGGDSKRIGYVGDGDLLMPNSKFVDHIVDRLNNYQIRAQELRNLIGIGGIEDYRVTRLLVREDGRSVNLKAMDRYNIALLAATLFNNDDSLRTSKAYNTADAITRRWSLMNSSERAAYGGVGELNPPARFVMEQVNAISDVYKHNSQEYAHDVRHMEARKLSGLRFVVVERIRQSVLGLLSDSQIKTVADGIVSEIGRRDLNLSTIDDLSKSLIDDVRSRLFDPSRTTDENVRTIVQDYRLKGLQQVNAELQQNLASIKHGLSGIFQQSTPEKINALAEKVLYSIEYYRRTQPGHEFSVYLNAQFDYVRQNLAQGIDGVINSYGTNSDVPYIQRARLMAEQRFNALALDSETRGHLDSIEGHLKQKFANALPEDWRAASEGILRSYINTNSRVEIATFVDAELKRVNITTNGSGVLSANEVRRLNSYGTDILYVLGIETGEVLPFRLCDNSNLEANIYRQLRLRWENMTFEERSRYNVTDPNLPPPHQFFIDGMNEIKRYIREIINSNDVNFGNGHAITTQDVNGKITAEHVSSAAQKYSERTASMYFYASAPNVTVTRVAGATDLFNIRSNGRLGDGSYIDINIMIPNAVDSDPTSYNKIHIDGDNITVFKKNNDGNYVQLRAQLQTPTVADPSTPVDGQIHSGLQDGYWRRAGAELGRNSLALGSTLAIMGLANWGLGWVMPKTQRAIFERDGLVVASMGLTAVGVGHFTSGLTSAWGNIGQYMLQNPEWTRGQAFRRGFYHAAISAGGIRAGFVSTPFFMATHRVISLTLGWAGVKNPFWREMISMGGALVTMTAFFSSNAGQKLMQRLLVKRAAGAGAAATVPVVGWGLAVLGVGLTIWDIWDAVEKNRQYYLGVDMADHEKNQQKLLKEAGQAKAEKLQHRQRVIRTIPKDKRRDAFEKGPSHYENLLRFSCQKYYEITRPQNGGEYLRIQRQKTLEWIATNTPKKTIMESEFKNVLTKGIEGYEKFVFEQMQEYKKNNPL